MILPVGEERDHFGYNPITNEYATDKEPKKKWFAGLLLILGFLFILGMLLNIHLNKYLFTVYTEDDSARVQSESGYTVALKTDEDMLLQIVAKDYKAFESMYSSEDLKHTNNLHSLSLMPYIAECYDLSLNDKDDVLYLKTICQFLAERIDMRRFTVYYDDSDVSLHIYAKDWLNCDTQHICIWFGANDIFIDDNNVYEELSEYLKERGIEE